MYCREEKNMMDAPALHDGVVLLLDLVHVVSLLLLDLVVRSALSQSCVLSLQSSNLRDS